MTNHGTKFGSFVNPIRANNWTNFDANKQTFSYLVTAVFVRRNALL